MRIRELILATLSYENQFPSLNCVPNVSVILNLILANSDEFPPLCFCFIVTVYATEINKSVFSNVRTSIRISSSAP